MKCFGFYIHSHFTASNLLWLIKHGVKVPKATGPRKFPKDLAEELLWINVGSLSTPVVLPSTGLTSVKARWAICIVLLPLNFIAEDLQWIQRGDWYEMLLLMSWNGEDRQFRRVTEPHKLQPAEQIFPLLVGHLCWCQDDTFWPSEEQKAHTMSYYWLSSCEYMFWQEQTW